MADEVIDIIDEVIPPEGGEGGEPTPPEPQPFDPNSMEFEDAYEFHGYNIDKLEGIPKDKLEETLGKYKELGFSQEQLEYVLLNGKKEEAPKNPREELAKHLTPAEKRNYKSVVTTVTNRLQGTELEQYTNDILVNPFLVKVFGLFSQETKPSISKKEINTKPTNKVSAVDALGKYNEFITGEGEGTTGEEKKAFINEMIKGSANQEELGQVFKDILEYL